MWGYTPRQLAGFMLYAHERRKLDLSEQLTINALAAQGNGKQIEATLKKLNP